LVTSTEQLGACSIPYSEAEVTNQSIYRTFTPTRESSDNDLGVREDAPDGIRYVKLVEQFVATVKATVEYAD
jgi:hypothetical protein